MVIEEKDFRMTQISPSSSFWDLELLKTIRPKGGEPRQEMSNAGYGLTLPGCLRAIANYRVASRHTEDVVTMKQYLSELLPELRKVKKYIDESLEFTEVPEEETQD